MRLRVIGRRDRIPPTLAEAIEAAERATAAGRGLELRIAVDYSVARRDSPRRLLDAFQPRSFGARIRETPGRSDALPAVPRSTWTCLSAPAATAG